ncbi:metal ABC transporter permease [Streptococcus jiangjianxini]|uniref:metal ABC transporter permease n=1 Tax=Streptococcus jiangjianxini TaxID=3161189 RepID=UPI0032EC03D7
MSEVLLIMIVIAMSCSLIGNILVISNQSMLADALSHSVLLGIVLGFFLTQDLNSPLLLIGASVFGVLTIVMIEGIYSQKIAQDAATGLVFTFFFALGVMLISLFARNVHLDLDVVLMGEVLFTPFVRSQLLGVDLPVALLRGILLLLFLALFYFLYFRRLSLYLFDKTQARLVGVNLGLLKMSLTFLVSLTIVAAFDSLGSITVISFLVAPAMIASLWSQTFLSFTMLSLLSSILLASLGYYLGMLFDVTVSGMSAVVALISFLVLLLVKNIVGLISKRKPI